MRKLLVLLSLVAVSAFAEPSFQQVEGLIQQKNFQSAEMALEQIIQAHPNSAKAFYAMAQAQAGLGNLEKAQYALNKAKAIDPELKFASSSNIESLTQAITPQTAKIEVVTESHFWRNAFIFFLVIAGGGLGMVLAANYTKRKEEAAEREAELKRREDELNAKVRAANAQPIKKTVEEPKADPVKSSYTPATASIATSGPAVPQPTYTPSAPSQPTVVNNHYGSSNDGFVTGMLVGNMLSGSHHDHTTIIERETVREVPRRDTSWDTPTLTPAPTRDTSWDDTPSTPSRSSSWDDDSSSKSSSSWSSSSSDSSSSWSSSSDSSSSWSSSDSGSSSSDW